MASDTIDLSVLDFWDRPAAERERDFATLRASAPISRQGPVEDVLVVDEAAPTGGGDFVELIAKRLPLMMISDMIGVPEADRERVRHAADMMVSVADPEISGDQSPLEALGNALWTLTEAANELAAHREEHRSDDLMTALVQAEIDGEKLTHASGNRDETVFDAPERCGERGAVLVHRLGVAFPA